MKNSNYIFRSIIALTAIMLCYACAKQSSPMGGPKDEEAPTLLSSNPKDQSLNIKPKEIILTFDEYIKTDNPTRNILITPSLQKDKMEILAVKNELRIKLNQELEDSTTYVFNFQKSIQDISESNPAENLKLVFSTGNMIDSLSFSGKVEYIMPQKKPDIEDVIVGLYRIEDDTMDVFTDPPYYLTQTDTAGRFEITNIKAGTYRGYAWHDTNNTSKAEDKSEDYGFIADTIRIHENVRDAHFNIYRGNLSVFKINRSSASGGNYDIVLSKIPSKFTINQEGIGSDLTYRIKDKNIRLYHEVLPNDSIPIRLNAVDSVGFKVDTTLYAKFEESERKLEKLEITLAKEKEFLGTIKTHITFNKPLASLSYDSLFIQYDSAAYINIGSENVYLEDSIVRSKLWIEVPVQDSLSNATYQLFAADSTFMDVEGLYNEKEIKTNFKKLNEENLADEVKGKVLTELSPLIVQLRSKDGTIVKEQYLNEGNEYTFKKIPAGEYQIQVIADLNNNKKWDPGNYLERRQPEPIFYYFDAEKRSNLILLRGKWTLQNININERRASGLAVPKMENQPEMPAEADTEIPEM